MTPSNANTSGLEVVAWRSTWVGHTGKTCHAYHQEKQEADGNAEHMSGASEPLVTAASAQARIAELGADLSKVIAQRDSHWDEYLAERQSRMEHGAREAGYLDAIPKLTDRATAAEARADRLADIVKLLDECIWFNPDTQTFEVNHDGSVEKARAALQPETQK